MYFYRIGKYQELYNTTQHSIVLHCKHLHIWIPIQIGSNVNLLFR